MEERKHMKKKTSKTKPEEDKQDEQEYEKFAEERWKYEELKHLAANRIKNKLSISDDVNSCKEKIYIMEKKGDKELRMALDLHATILEEQLTNDVEDAVEALDIIKDLITPTGYGIEPIENILKPLSEAENKLMSMTDSKTDSKELRIRKKESRRQIVTGGYGLIEPNTTVEEFLTNRCKVLREKAYPLILQWNTKMIQQFNAVIKADESLASVKSFIIHEEIFWHQRNNSSRSEDRKQHFPVTHQDDSHSKKKVKKSMPVVNKQSSRDTLFSYNEIVVDQDKNTKVHNRTESNHKTGHLRKNKK